MGEPGSQSDLKLVNDKESLAAAASAEFVSAARSAVAARGRFLVALSGGSTPKAMFSLLADPAYQSRIDWPAVHIFWGDERLVASDDPGSNYYHARQLLLDHVPIPPPQIHRVRGELATTDAVADYGRQLRTAASGEHAWPRFDLAIMGLGADGHTASLFPGSAAVSEKIEPVLAVTAEYEDRPAQRITLTPPVFNDSRQVLFLVAGADKATALLAVRHGAEDIQKWPAQAIRPLSGSLTWVVDEAAAGLSNNG